MKIEIYIDPGTIESHAQEPRVMRVQRMMIEFIDCRLDDEEVNAVTSFVREEFSEEFEVEINYCNGMEVY